MAIQIGAKTHSFSDPTALLSDCHRRVEMFLQSLQAVAQTANEPLTDESSAALNNALRYFREAAPKHTADEEESLFPRLRQIEDPELKLALGKMDALEQDHRWAEPLHQLVDGLGQKYLLHRKLAVEESQRFRDSIRILSAMYKQHIATEDKNLFPIAHRVLSAEAKAEIAEEMAKRRHLG